MRKIHFWYFIKIAFYNSYVDRYFYLYKEEKMFLLLLRLSLIHLFSIAILTDRRRKSVALHQQHNILISSLTHKIYLDGLYLLAIKRKVVWGWDVSSELYWLIFYGLENVFFSFPYLHWFVSAKRAEKQFDEFIWKLFNLFNFIFTYVSRYVTLKL